MRESRTSGFVRGAHSNMCPYRDPYLSRNASISPAKRYDLMGVNPVLTLLFPAVLPPTVRRCIGPTVAMGLLPYRPVSRGGGAPITT